MTGYIDKVGINYQPDGKPYLEFAVHQCAQFQYDPRFSHSKAVKRIFRYLILTSDKEITFKPNLNLKNITRFVKAIYCSM